MSKIRPEASKVYQFLYRKIIGYQWIVDRIELSQIEEGTGLSKRSVPRALSAKGRLRSCKHAGGFNGHGKRLHHQSCVYLGREHKFSWDNAVQSYQWADLYAAA